MWRGRAGQVKPWVTWADLLTALRVPLAIAFPFVHHPGAQLGVVAAVAATDFFDGMLARRFGSSRAGAVLDPVADKLFMAAAFLTVARSGRLHPLEIVGVLARDIVAALAFLGAWIGRRPATLPARAGGKAVTVCQLLTLVAFIADSSFVRPLAWATAAIGPSRPQPPGSGRRDRRREADCVGCDVAHALGRGPRGPGVPPPAGEAGRGTRHAHRTVR